MINTKYQMIINWNCFFLVCINYTSSTQTFLFINPLIYNNKSTEPLFQTKNVDFKPQLRQNVIQ